MILRRIAKGIKNQDWFVVVLEIFIVVIGIYIGLQVDGWNEARQERVLEQEYLERIYQDLLKDKAEIESSILVAENRLERAHFLLSSVDSPMLIEDDPTYFIASIELAGYTREPSITNHTFEEIKSSGRLLILRSDELRAALGAYYDSILQRQQWSFVRQEIQINYLESSMGILDADQTISMALFDTGTLTVEEAREVYTRMMARPEYIMQLPQIIQYKIRNVSNREGFLENVKTLIDLIRREQGLEESP